LTDRLRIIWSKSAANDLASIVDYLISENSPRAAFHIYRQIMGQIESMAAFPRRGRHVPELEGVGMREFREIVSSPYRIVYIIDGKKLVLSGILDARRDLEETLIERATRIDL